MSRLPTINPVTATGPTGGQLARTNQVLGLIPNMAKVMANSPALLQGYLDLNIALAQGVLSAGVRERIAVAVSESNGCDYCLSAHTYIGEHIAKVAHDEIERARDARSSDPHTQAVLTLANEIVRGQGDVDDRTLAAVRAAGVTDAEIGETVGNVAINILTNYFNKLAEVDIDWPVVTTRRQAA